MNILKEIKYRSGRIEFFETFRGTVVDLQNRSEHYSSQYSGDTVAVINGVEYAEKGYSVSYTNSVDTIFAQDENGKEDSFKTVDGIPFRSGNKIRVIGLVTYTKTGERFTPVKQAIVINETLNKFHISTSAEDLHFKTGHDMNHPVADLIFGVFGLGGLASLFFVKNLTLMNVVPFGIAFLAWVSKKVAESKTESGIRKLGSEVYTFAQSLTRKEEYK